MLAGVAGSGDRLDLGFVICYWAGAVTGDVWTTRRELEGGGNGGTAGEDARAGERAGDRAARRGHGYGRDDPGMEGGRPGVVGGRGGGCRFCAGVGGLGLGGGWVHEEGAGDYRGR